MAKNAKDEEQMRKMQQYVNKMTEDNFKLKQQLDDQRETSIWNKKLLGNSYMKEYIIYNLGSIYILYIDEYISNITTQGGLVEKLQSTIETLYSKIDAQQKIIDHLQYVYIYIYISIYINIEMTPQGGYVPQEE